MLYFQVLNLFLDHVELKKEQKISTAEMSTMVHPFLREDCRPFGADQ